MMMKMMALAAAGAAFVATPAQATDWGWPTGARAVFYFSISGDWTIDETIHHALGDTHLPTRYSSQPLDGFFNLETNYGYFDLPGGWSPGTVTGVQFAGDTMTIYGVPPAHGGFSVTLKFDHDLENAFPENIDGFVSGYFDMLGYAASASTTWMSGDATLTSARMEGALPEPATWAMMIAGFGLAGAALRSRRRVSVALA